ncbi:cytochrome P450 [Cubamyces sp. BRFM 1775]|nr:cytochrome P450 [Cubamyces sp. BRFM 1775]
MGISILVKVPLVIILVTLGSLLWKIRPFILGQFTSPFLRIRGPRSSSWLFGQHKERHESGDDYAYDRWFEEYGPLVMIRGFFNMPRLLTSDTRVINHVLTHSADYQKPEQARRTLARLLGDGVLITEGDTHRQQRRIMNPAFGPSQIRELTEIFVEKAVELRDVWMKEISDSSDKGDSARINVMRGLSKMTLDVIGLAGFNYEFHALNPTGEPNELAKAFEDIFVTPDKIPVLRIMRNFFPILDLIKTEESRRIDEALAVMSRIGSQLIAEKKAEILRQSSEKGDGLGRKSLQGRDLLTLLIRANMATDIPENQRLSDEDVLAQVPTFLVAGHETTSTATTWCLYALTQAPNVQQKLREELLSMGTDNPTMDELMALPYLDMVVRESLRVYAPVPETVRVAKKEDVIPLEKPFTDKDGQTHSSIKIAPGSSIVIPIKTLNRSKEIWGEDAHEFRPERWEDPPEAVSSIPGVWGHMLTFLGGPRACIGYRFSLVEMKALIYTLVRAFEFELAVSPSDIKLVPGIVERPRLRSEPSQGNQMPLIVRKYNDRA